MMEAKETMRFKRFIKTRARSYGNTRSKLVFNYLLQPSSDEHASETDANQLSDSGRMLDAERLEW
jgi:hypothetical protein